MAEIALDSLSVSYHQLGARRCLLARVDGWLEPAAQAKGDNGPWRQAQWLGNGLLAVAGTDWHGVGTTNGNVIVERLTERPSGLQIIDTSHWTVHTLDPNADSFTITNGLLLATGTRWDVSQTENRTTGEGLIGYDAHGKQRLHLFAGHAVSVNETFAGRAYLTVVDPSGTEHQHVVDLRTGHTIQTPVFDWPELLLGNGGPSAS